MLFLSHADRGEKARREPIASLSALCSEVAEYYEAVFLESGLNCSISGDACGSFDGALLRRAVSNLLNNATRHAHSKARFKYALNPIKKEGHTFSYATSGLRSQRNLFHIFLIASTVLTRREFRVAKITALASPVSAIARMHDGNTTASCKDGVTTIGIYVLHET
jgi:two-component system heavy metal sensor histidine kinase CusS